MFRVCTITPLNIDVEHMMMVRDGLHVNYLDIHYLFLFGEVVNLHWLDRYKYTYGRSVCSRE
jgi:hypothetical protein